MSESIAGRAATGRATVPVADAAQRERALDPSRSFIVQAPAGSGKTELLIQRFLVLLARVERPEEITAITFTRKAAAEMRKRIFDVLHLARHEPRPSAAYRARTWELGRAVLERSDALGWAIEEGASRVRVQTIDALCASLTRQMPLLSRFGAQPESIDDATLLYLEAARATLALVEDESQHAATVARVLEHLDNDTRRAEALIADLLARRDQWMRLLDLADSRAALEAILAQTCREGIEHARALFPPGYALPEGQDLDAWKAMAATYITNDGAWRRRPAVPEALTSRAGLLEALCALRALPKPRYDDAQWEMLAAILGIAHLAAAQLKLVFAAHGQADFTEITQAALDALHTHEGPTDLLLALDYRIRHILVDEFQDTSYSQFDLLRRLTSGWTEGDGRTLFVVGDPMQSIYRFREAEVGLFLRARREGIGTVALESLRLSANFRSQAGIVAWVNAAFARMLPAQEDIGRGAVPYSASVAVRAPLTPAVTVHPFYDGDVQGEAREVARVTRAALETRAKEAPATVAILARNRSHLAAILPCLRAAGLRFHAIEIEGLVQRPLVQDLIGLTRALWHPADRTAWLAILRAPWCGLPLDDLWQLAGIDVEPGAPVQSRRDPPLVWDRLNDEAVLDRLSADGAARARRLRAVLGESLASRRRGRLRDAVEGAWLALAGPACMASAGDMEDVTSYLDHLGAAEEGGALGDFEHFERSLEHLFAAPDAQASERLQVMTIHKAKGLEFDTVIVPGLGAAGRSDDRKLFVWMERPAASAGSSVEFLLSPLDATGNEADPIYRYIRALDRDKEALQDARLLYVAATRARRALHLMGDVKWDGHAHAACEPRRESLLHHLWPVVHADFVRAPTPPQQLQLRLADDAPVAAGDTIERLRPEAMRIEVPAAVAFDVGDAPRAPGEDIEFSWASETARHAGTVVHRWLQRIAAEGVDAWDRARIERLRPAFRHALAARGVNEADLEAAVVRVSGALHGCLEDPRARWILGPHAEARTEHRITLLVDGRLRAVAIDRMFRDAGRLWIIDYKTSAHEGGDRERFLDRELERYRPQLDGYRVAFGDEPVGLGLYFPLMKGWREWSA